MTTNTENTGSSMDGLKWGIVVLLLVGTVVGNMYAADQESIHFLARVVGVVVAVGLAGFVAAITTKGKTFITFAQEAKVETRKVVWPTRQEALQTTFIVLAVSAVVALILWGLDGILVRVVNFVTGV